MVMEADEYVDFVDGWQDSKTPTKLDELNSEIGYWKNRFEANINDKYVEWKIIKLQSEIESEEEDIYDIEEGIYDIEEYISDLCDDTIEIPF